MCGCSAEPRHIGHVTHRALSQQCPPEGKIARCLFSSVQVVIGNCVAHCFALFHIVSHCATVWLNSSCVAHRFTVLTMEQRCELRKELDQKCMSSCQSMPAMTREPKGAPTLQSTSLINAFLPFCQTLGCVASAGCCRGIMPRCTFRDGQVRPALVQKKLLTKQPLDFHHGD